MQTRKTGWVWRRLVAIVSPACCPAATVGDHRSGSAATAGILAPSDILLRTKARSCILQDCRSTGVQLCT